MRSWGLAVWVLVAPIGCCPMVARARGEAERRQREGEGRGKSLDLMSRSLGTPDSSEAIEK